MPTIAITVDSNAADILRQWSNWPQESRTRMVKNVARELILIQGQVRSKAELNWRSGARGLSGRLTSYARPSEYGLGLDAAIGFRKTKGFPYELSQEFGAKAKPGKAMAIPVTPEARKAGSPRNMTARLFIPWRKHVLAESRGPYLIVHYVLVKSIKPRLGFRKTVLDNVDRISKAIIDGFTGRAA